MPLEVPELQSGNPQLQRAMAKIVKAEQRPIDKVDEKIAKIENKANLVKDLKNKFIDMREAVKPFKSVTEFRELIGISSDPAILSASTIDKAKATPGTYDIEVLGLASTASLMTRGVPDRDRTELGVGYISFSTPDGESHDVYINSSNNTLDGIANKINSSGLGVKATVINDGTDSDSPWRLVLSGEKSGWRNDYDWAEFNFLDGDLDLDRDRVKSATSAIIKLNGQPMYVDENNVKDVIPGVTFDLKRAAAGQNVKLEIKPDLEKIETKAKTMVDKLNAVLSFIQNQNATNSGTAKDPSKALAGDTSLQTVESRLRTIIQSTVENADDKTIQRIRDIGIMFNRNGTLEYDGKKFQSALETKFTEVADLLSGTSPLNGFAYQVGQLVEGVTRTGDGVLTIREGGFTESKARLEKEKEAKTAQAEKKIERVKMQFARAESAMAELQNFSGVAQSIASAGRG